MKHHNQNKPFDPIVFWVSATVTILFVLGFVAFPELMNTAINAVFAWTTGNWGWLYLWTAFLLAIGCFALMGGRMLLLVMFGTFKGLGSIEDIHNEKA